MQRAAASLASSRSAAAWACSSSASRHAGTGAVCSARHDAVVPLRIRGQEQPPAALPMSLSLLSRRRPARTAAAAAVELTPAADEGGIAGTMQLGAMIVAWYLLNIYFNIYNKQVLQMLPLPLPYTITAFQLAFGSLVIFLMWAARLHPVPRLSAAQLARIAPLAAGHMLGTVFTNMSLGRVAVSFTHTVKASEPFFTVLLSAFFLGEVPSPLVLGSLVPIVGGVALASLTEGRILERHGVESAQPDQECAQQAAPRRRRGVHGRHKPLLGDHRAVLPAVLPSHDLRRGGQVLPSVPPEHRPEPAGAVREGGPGRPLLPWLPEAVVHDPGEGVARDPLRGQLRQACGGHRLLRPLLPDAHLPYQCTGDWCGTSGSLPVLQAQENKAKEFMKMCFFSCFINTGFEVVEE